MEVRLELFAVALLGLASLTACAEANSAPGADAAPGSPDASPGMNDAAPGPADAPYTADPGARVFTGELEGTDARVAVIATEHHARMYFCGGDSTYTMLSRWVTADLAANGDVVADRSAMAWSIHATAGPSTVSGTLSTGDASTYSFVAIAVEKKTIAGLYEAVSPCGKVGVIVSQKTEAETPVAQGACIGNGNIDIHQVNPVLPLQRSADGAISVVVAGEAQEISVVPAAAPAN
jgi:hypothetical protein